MRGVPDVVVDVMIFGGGIAGLWLLDRLRREGFSAVLLERDRLGAGQSVASQGIIHGGTKYTFGLMRDTAVDSLRAMPATWRDSVRGVAGPDLSRATTLSPCTHMWLPRQFGGSVVGAFSRLLMRSSMTRVSRSDWPEALDSDRAAGTLYALDEIVLDIPSVLAALLETHRDFIRRIPDGVQPEIDAVEGTARVGDVTFRAQRIVLTGGAGNGDLMRAAGITDVPHQRRPLHQVMVGGMKRPLYCHCVGRSPKPLATITSHPTSTGDYVWYVGGGLAEEGVAVSEADAIRAAQRTLPELLPGADFADARWATFRIDRAEAVAAGRHMPGGPSVVARDAVVIAWPTKLALAPSLADQVLALLRGQGTSAMASQLEALDTFAPPEVAPAPWETVDTWS